MKTKQKEKKCAVYSEWLARFHCIYISQIEQIEFAFHCFPFQLWIRFFIWLQFFYFHLKTSRRSRSGPLEFIYDRKTELTFPIRILQNWEKTCQWPWSHRYIRMPNAPRHTWTPTSFEHSISWCFALFYLLSFFAFYVSYICGFKKTTIEYGLSLNRAISLRLCIRAAGLGCAQCCVMHVQCAWIRSVDKISSFTLSSHLFVHSICTWKKFPKWIIHMHWILL